MATPVIAGTNTSVGSGGSLTAALPASIAAGDLLLMLVVVASNAAQTVTTPTGWTQLFNDVGPGLLRRLACFYKTATGSEGSSVSITASGGGLACLTWRITGWTGTPAAGTTATGSSTAPTPPSLSPSWGSGTTLWLACMGDAVSSSSIAPPTNYSNGFQADQTSTSPQAHAAAASRALTAASEDPGAFTISSGSWAANTIAIQGAPSNFSQTVSVTSTAAPTIINSVGKAVSATTTGAAGILKSVSKSLSGITSTISVSIAAGRAFLQTIAVTVSSSVSIGRSLIWTKLVSASVTSTVSVTKSIDKTISASVSNSVQILKTVGKIITAGATGIVSFFRSRFRIITQGSSLGNQITTGLERSEDITTPRYNNTQITS